MSRKTSAQKSPQIIHPHQAHPIVYAIGAGLFYYPKIPAQPLDILG